MSAIAICNRALQMINEDRINQIDPPEDTPAAKACNLAYSVSRDALIEEHPWNFAMARAALPALATAPAWGYARQFALPADCLRVWDIQNAACADWVVEGNAILSDEAAPLAVRYIQRVTDTTRMTPMFRELLAQRVAMAVGPSLRPGARELRVIAEAHTDLLRRAKTRDAQESAGDRLAADTWLAFHHGRVPGV